MLIFPLLLALLSFIAALVLIPYARQKALKSGFVDAPGGRKDHAEAVPPIGGLVIFPVYIAAALLMGLPMSIYWPLFTALGLLLVMGYIDDRYVLGAWAKFCGHLAAAALIVLFGQARLYTLGDLFGPLFGDGDFGLGLVSIPFSLAAVVLLINAVNLMDGLDGLAGGQGFVALFWLLLAAFLGGNIDAVTALAPMMAVLAGFLFYNMRRPFRHRASVFLGDAGSLALGLTLAWFCIDLAQAPGAVLAPISVAWILALPIFDICGQFYRRVREGRHPFSADRGHFHHHFIHAGIPVGRATALILLSSFILGGIGYIGSAFNVPPVILTVTWMACLFLHMFLSHKPERYIHLLSYFKQS